MTDYERGVEQASAIYKEVIREYVAENDKLRELVRSFHSGMLFMLETGMWATDPKWLEEQMEDLGVEVGA